MSVLESGMSVVDEAYAGAYRNVVIHSIGFFLIFSGTQTMGTFQAALLKDAGLGDLGFTSLALAYGCFSVCRLAEN
jgi:hypothetical protein